MDIVVAANEGVVAVTVLDGDLAPGPVELLDGTDFADRVRALEAERPRWVWADTRAVYPRLLQAAVRVQRCRDLRLCHAILSSTPYLSLPLTGADDPRWQVGRHRADEEPTLLDLPPPGGEVSVQEAVAEHVRQVRAVDDSPEADRLRLLLAAESAGALIAAELEHVGLPWNVQVHDEQLTRALGPRPSLGGRPAKLEAYAERIRAALAAPGLNPDSPTELLRALHAGGVEVATTRKEELERVAHPVIEPLLAYKKLARLLAANGWDWMFTWVHDGRFHPDYVPAGVVTGRWATRGGGALQLPRQIRAAVVAEVGHRLVVADAAQLEPRVLAAMSRDEAMAAASRGSDLYQALVDQRVVDTRGRAKVAMLGALYGATAGEAGALMPRLLQAYPAATATVERAARAGERGEIVTTWLGRGSPPPPEHWHQGQRRASDPDADEGDRRRARRQARDWGRFTRNFVVQGTAAEWALCWLADLRLRLARLPAPGGDPCELVYFLHDEVIVHCPDALLDEVVEAVRAAADKAGRLLFGTFDVDFALNVSCVRSYAEAKG